MNISLKLALLPLLLLLSIVCGSVSAMIFQLDTGSLIETICDPEIHFALGMSLGSSLISLCLAMLIAIPAAWLMNQVKLPGQSVIDTLLDLPMVLPPLVTGMGLLLLISPQGPLAQLLPSLRGLVFSPAGIIIAQTYVATAIMLRSCRGAFSTIDPGYRLTAYNLGLSPLATLIKVELPLCWRPLVCGAILAWSRAIGEFGATLMLAGATRFRTETLPMAIYLNISSGDFQLAIGAALWLLVIAACLLFVTRAINRCEH
ncbi:ABC transporter permease [Photobacterium sp. J15]|uniref:ABC transporter permease n=1 Tax=Photobacterium sp. J15 TaxID=265901 RepID=UPI0007E367CB|nr:ABC transporter permease [Photobacterium sp. J15]